MRQEFWLHLSHSPIVASVCMLWSLALSCATLYDPWKRKSDSEDRIKGSKKEPRATETYYREWLDS